MSCDIYIRNSYYPSIYGISLPYPQRSLIVLFIMFSRLFTLFVTNSNLILALLGNKIAISCKLKMASLFKQYVGPTSTRRNLL